MPDILFYHDKKVYTYYNKHDSVVFKANAFTEEQTLCQRALNLKVGDIFSDFRSLSVKESSSHGNRDMSIQDLNQLFKASKEFVVDIADHLQEDQLGTLQ
mmetsp:Transcript_9006/g.15243  ORF Transcript_9006/g.15243 Transcript_9006/m.15243 type:complete len:100 (-) Transcript_9006:1038-1337(-)